MDKSYKSAIQVLNRRRRPMRPSTEPAGNFPGLNRIPTLGGQLDLRGTPNIIGMKKWLDQLGHSAADIDNLDVIHVAGTKGKGSTCAFIESFLRVHGRRTGFQRKTGLYTSPHLIYPEERIRINFEPLPRDLFAKYFFEVYDSLSQHNPDDFDIRPRYLQLFALVSFHTFIREGVDVAILETHHGGEYDVTNVIEKPIVTAITSLGMDHVKQLGPSIKNIAWHKAGIFKPGALAFSPPQEAAAAEVLRSRAADKGVSLQFVDHDPSLPTNALQLTPEVQRTNCSVALAVVSAFLNQRAPGGSSHLNPSDVLQGVSQFSWPGRFQLVVEKDFQWFLDGAHNEMSVIKAAEWFIEAARMKRIASSDLRILIFSQITEQRNPAAVFECLANSISANEIQYVIFTVYDSKQVFDSEIDTEQKKLSEMPFQDSFMEIWKRIHPASKALFEPTIQGALEITRKIGNEHGGVQTLITGSQHLVGGALHLLKLNELDKECVDQL